MQKVGENARSQNATLCKNLDFDRENLAPVIHVTKNLTPEKNKLQEENETFRSTIFKLESENNDLKKV